MEMLKEILRLVDLALAAEYQEPYGPFQEFDQVPEIPIVRTSLPDPEKLVTLRAWIDDGKKMHDGHRAWI